MVVARKYYDGPQKMGQEANRFAKHFDAEGNPSETLLRAKQDRLENWRLLQELAGVI